MHGFQVLLIDMVNRILVLCTGNSCRSQMAHGYLDFFGKDKVQVLSAGLEKHGVNPRAILAMKEDGIDISHHTSNLIGEYSNLTFDYVITVCDNAKENCPYFPARIKVLHHNFPDPAKAKGSEEEIAREFRQVRAMIKNYCKDFVNTYVK
jgi:arsenate reductase